MLDFNCLTHRAFYSLHDVLQLHDQNQDKSRRIIVEYQGAEYANLNHIHIESLLRGTNVSLARFTQARYLSSRIEYVFSIGVETNSHINSFEQFINYHIFQDSIQLVFLDFTLHIPTTAIDSSTRCTLLKTIWNIFSFYGPLVLNSTYRLGFYFRRLDGSYTEVRLYGARSRCKETYPYLVPEHKNINPLIISNNCTFDYTGFDGADQVLVVQWLKLLDTVFPDLIDTLEAHDELQDALDVGALA